MFTNLTGNNIYYVLFNSFVQNAIFTKSKMAATATLDTGKGLYALNHFTDFQEILLQCCFRNALFNRFVKHGQIKIFEVWGDTILNFKDCNNFRTT